ncbi:MAG: hypothetical protein EOP87_09785 [Verrucomicrobiaceae bacterium]|nr:MAG: hypothetical protein EOP87_09785 [Verrucomicrobiaceae bacterium]
MKPILLLLACAGLACAQNSNSTIAPAMPYAYAANAGWLTFYPSVTYGVVVTETYLAGYAYGANIGWVRLGYVRPDNFHTYSQGNTTDFGVNVSPTGLLTGYAYSANVGWINFEQTYGKPRIDLFTGRFTGYAYSANIGWLALDAPGAGLAAASLHTPDNDGDDISTAWEYANFGSENVADELTDYDKDGVSDLREFLAGTDPKNPADFLSVISTAHTAGTTTTSLEFTSRTNRRYTIERSADLSGTWVDSGLGLFAPSAAATTSKSVTHPAAGRQFFRVTVRRPFSP